MKFRVVIVGKLLGIQPVRLTPFDIAVAVKHQAAAREIAAGAKPKPLNLGAFRGEIRLETT